MPQDDAKHVEDIVSIISQRIRVNDRVVMHRRKRTRTEKNTHHNTGAAPRCAPRYVPLDEFPRLLRQRGDKRPQEYRQYERRGEEHHVGPEVQHLRYVHGCHVRGFIAQHDSAVPDDECGERPEENHVREHSLDHHHWPLHEDISGKVQEEREVLSQPRAFDWKVENVVMLFQRVDHNETSGEHSDPEDVRLAE